MKKLLPVVVAAILFTSCEKNYTCTCVYPGSTIGTTKTTFKAKKKSQAESNCADLNTQAKTNGGSCAM
jgi:hypothetical protein